MLFHDENSLIDSNANSITGDKDKRNKTCFLAKTN